MIKRARPCTHWGHSHIPNSLWQGQQQAKACAWIQTFLGFFFSQISPLSVIKLEVWSLIWSGEIVVHLCPKSATLVMTPWRFHQCSFPPLQILSSSRSSVEEGWNLEPASDFRNKTFSFKLSRTRQQHQLLISEHAFNNSFLKDKITFFSPARTHNLLNWLMKVHYYYTQNKHYC